jgi:hypothetical protein
MLDLLDFIARDDRFSKSIRVQCLYFSAHLAFALPVPDFLQERVLPNVERLGIQKEFDELKKPLDLYVKLDFSSAEAIAGWMDSQRKALEPFDQMDISLFNECFQDLCRLGRLDLAEKQIKDLKNIQFATTVGNSSFAMQLQWNQEVERLKELIPDHHVLQAFYLQQIQPDYERPDCADFSMYRPVDLARLQATYGALLQHGLYDHTTLLFWRDLNDVEYRNGHICVNEKNLDELIKGMLSLCESDQQYAMIVSVLPELFDGDHAECARIYQEATDPLLARAELEQTHASLIYHRYASQIRNGHYKQASADLKTETGLTRRNLHYLRVQSMLLSEETGMLNDYLNSADPDLLLADDQLDNTLQAYKKCGRKAEYTLLSEKGMDVLRECMASATIDGNRWMIYRTVALAEAMDVLGTLDEPWIDQVAENARPDDVAYLQMHRFHALENWGETERYSRELVACAPTYYGSYYFLGKALVEQKKYNEGIEALGTFLRYCKDSLHYREALRLDASAKKVLGASSSGPGKVSAL